MDNFWIPPQQPEEQIQIPLYKELDVPRTPPILEPEPDPDEDRGVVVISIFGD